MPPAIEVALDTWAGVGVNEGGTPLGSGTSIPSLTSCSAIVGLLSPADSPASTKTFLQGSMPDKNCEYNFE